MPAINAPGRSPMIGISCCIKDFNGTANHAASSTYVEWTSETCDAIPVLLPALGRRSRTAGLLSRLDGLMLTGSRTNVEPHHYGAEHHPEAEPYDAERDEAVLPLIRGALKMGMPVLAICRGFQELNVALGGSLHRRVQALPDRFDHSTPREQTLEVKTALAHRVDLAPGGLFARLLGKTSIRVNSLHNQAVDRAASGLVIEGVAPDGTLEAARVADCPGFAIGVQWHPERRTLDDEDSAKLFAAFGNAVHAYTRGEASAAA